MLWFRRDLMWLFFIHRCVHTSSHHASILACTPQSTALHLSTSIYLCFWWFVGLACTNFLCQTPSPYDLRWNSSIVLFVWCFFFVLWENVGVFWPFWTEFSSEFSTGRISWTFCRSHLNSCFCFSFTATLLTSSFFSFNLINKVQNWLLMCVIWFVHT